MTRLIVFSLVFILVGCQTAPKQTEPVAEAPEDTQATINYTSLKKHLGLSRSDSDLGYKEARFNTCDKGIGLPNADVCEQNYLVTVHFRLQCRDSQGTVSQALTSSDLQAIAGKNVSWNLKGVNGTAKTDSSGFAQITAISPISQKTQRLRLAVGTEFLYIRAGEINRIVTPGTWCDEYN